MCPASSLAFLGPILPDTSCCNFSKSLITISRSLLLFAAGISLTAVVIEKDYELTKREMDVLEQIAKGLSYDQISENLFISYGTARKHVENIYKKMRVHNKIEAIEKAKKSGLI